MNWGRIFLSLRIFIIRLEINVKHVPNGEYSNISYYMTRKLTISIGILVWITTPLLLSIFYDINIMEILKSFFSLIHLLTLSSVFLVNYTSRHKIQKILVLTAFTVYPLLLTAHSTRIFGETTFILVFITAWIYVMGFAGWLYTEKQIQ